VNKLYLGVRGFSYEWTMDHGGTGMCIKRTLRREQVLQR
jgi:hypothetical protein